MQIDNNFLVYSRRYAEITVRDDSGLRLELDFKPYLSAIGEYTNNSLIQHYMALPKNIRTFAFWEPSTNRYVPIVIGIPIYLPVTQLAMLRNGNVRPTLRQPEAVNLLIGLTLNDLNLV